MLEHDRIDVSVDTEINKTSDSGECKVNHYWYFFKTNFTYQCLACDGFHDLAQK